MIETNLRPDRVVLSKTAVAAVGATYLFMGLVVSAYGPLLEHLTRRFAVTLPVAGATISIHFAGTLLGVLVAMRVLELLPVRTTVITAVVFAGAGCAGIALAPAWPLFMAGVFLTGVGFGALLISLNQLVAYSESERRVALLNALNSAYSAGAVAGPIVVATFASSHFATLYLTAAVAVLLLIPGHASISGRLPIAVGPRGRPSPLVLIFVAAFVMYVAIENGTGGWMTTHLESTGLHSAGAAATVTSAFWLALVAGRLLMTVMPAGVPERTIVIGASSLAATALIAASFGPLAPAAYVVTGFALAPIFPTAVVWLARLSPGDSRATSWLYPAASVGGIVGPGAIGLVVAAYGVRWAPAVLGVVAIAMSVTFWLANRRAAA